MKNIITAIIFVAILLTIGFFLGKGCSKELPIDYSEEVARLERDTTKAGLTRDSLRLVIDSLETIPPEIRKQIIYREREINESIAKDSSNSLVEYRRSLVDNDYLPDGTLYLSYREIGLGAILMAKVPKLELTIKLYETETIPTLKASVKNYQVLYQSSQELNEIKDLTINEQALKIKKGEAWYNSKILWFGVGVLASGITVYLLK